MFHRNKFSNKMLVGLMSLGFAGTIAAAPLVGHATPSADSTGRPATDLPAGGNTAPLDSPASQLPSSSQAPSSQTPSDLPVTETQPEGAERESAPRTPADAVENENKPMTPDAQAPSSSQAPASGTPDLPVTEPQPGGTERESAPRTPADAIENENAPMSPSSQLPSASEVPSSGTPSDLPVTEPQPGGTERESAPRTPADAVENNPSGAGNMEGSNSCTPGSSSSMGTPSDRVGSTSGSMGGAMSQPTPGSLPPASSIPSSGATGTESSLGSSSETNMSCTVR